MCGISGFNWKDEEKIRGMSSCISYRGPDADGVFVDDRVSFGHNRLSVIDLSSGANQPMQDNSGELIIVFNGEIYNFLELRRELEKDYVFKTKSDTEVILAGYRKWGRGVVEKLNGMFGFAIYDKRDGSIFAARDHMGMKPFYYFWDSLPGSQYSGKFIFASEISAILAHDIPRKLDTEALNHYLRVFYVPEPNTLIKNIYKLPPSHTLLLKNGQLDIAPYGESSNRNKTSYKEAVSLVRDKVNESIARHLAADVPVGVYLSGGIDSSIVLASMSRIHKKIKTFTIGFELGDGEEREKFNADLDLAKKTAEFFNASHTPVMISSKDAIEVFDEVVAHNSDPISNPTSIAMFLLSRAARKEVTVVLTGNASDELFGGYERYRKAILGRYLYSRVGLLAKFMFEKDHKLKRVLMPGIFQKASLIKARYAKYMKGGDAIEALMNTDQRSWLADHFFMLSDKMSMANALEERMPFADKELVGLARSLPRKYKVDTSGTKKVLKDAFRSELPEFLFNQPKRGWFSPAAKWLRHPDFVVLANKLLSEDYYDKTKKLFNWQEIATILNDHISKKEYNLNLIWALMTFQAWAKHYKVEP